MSVWHSDQLGQFTNPPITHCPPDCTCRGVVSNQQPTNERGTRDAKDHRTTSR